MAPTNAFHVKFFQFLPPGCPPPPDTFEECMRRPDTLGDPERQKCLVVLILPTHKAEAGNLRNFLQIKLAILLLFSPWCCFGRGGQRSESRKAESRERQRACQAFEGCMGPPQGKCSKLQMLKMHMHTSRKHTVNVALCPSQSGLMNKHIVKHIVRLL